MKFRLPSPSMVVACVALIVALGGSAVAAKYVISSSSQIRNGVITGADVKNNALSGIDIKNGSVKGADLAPGTVSTTQLRSDVRSALAKPAVTSATEVVRATGPQVTAKSGGSATVATLKGLAPGAYLITAKSVIAAVTNGQSGLLDALLQSSTHDVKCSLDAGGNSDDAMGTIITPGSSSTTTLNLQLTRTLASPADVVLRCESDVPWSAGGTSIVASAVGATTRTSVDG